MKKLNKVLFGFGSIAAVVAPVAAVVACDDDTPAAEAVKFTATTKFTTEAAFATEAVKQLKDKDVENGVVFTIGDKSFNTKDGLEYTAITKDDVKTEAKFTAWLTKVKGTYTSLKTSIAEYKAKSTDAEKATWIKAQITAHPHFAQVFGFKSTDTDAKLVETATAKLALFDKAEATLNALV